MLPPRPDFRLGGMPRHPVFVTRKFPPSVGGMETLAAGVWRSVHAVRPDSVKISHGRSNRGLIWWVPACLARLTWLCLRGRAEYVLCGDALMNALCAPLLRTFRIQQATMIMGLDVTYENRLYRALVLPPLRSAARVIAISAATAGQARDAGVPADRIAVLRLGVQPPPAGRPGRPRARAAVRRRLSLADDQLVLLTLGRLVRRKGARWFTESVLPQLDEHVHYVVAGQGPEEQAIRAAAEATGVAKRLHLLGRVDDDAREELMSGADVFLAPNIPVPGDMEGFGLVTVEAAMRGTPVVASALEGINDAVENGRTGILLPPSDVHAWVSELTALLAAPADLPGLGDRFLAHAVELYSEEAMGRALCAQLGLGHAEPIAEPKALSPDEWAPK
jgi:phosphatidyl-myo-inositol dimannoside synthase